MNHFFLTILQIACVGLFSMNGYAQPTDRPEDHEALRQLMKTAEEALNKGQYDLLTPILVEDHFSITTVDNQRFTSLSDFSAYWQGLFTGKSAILNKIVVRPKADAKTEFLDENLGAVHGTSDDTYHFTDGDVRNMQTRWTAVVQKDQGVWKIVKIHFSANILNNPVLDYVKSQTLQWGGGGILAGLLVGVGLMWFVRPRHAH